MSDAEHIPLTEKELESFDVIKSMIREKMPLCLMRIVIDNKPEAAICVLRSTESKEEIDIIPLAVLVSTELFKKIDTPEDAIEVDRNKEKN